MTQAEDGIAVIILAGGKSTRFNGNKLLAPLNNSSVLQRTIKPYLELDQISDIIIVTGAFHHEIVKYLQGSNLTIIENSDFKQGMASSIVTGIKQIDLENITGVFIHPGDIPFILKDDIVGMISHLDSQSIIIPSYQSHRGHPVLIHRKLIAGLRSVDHYEMGLRSYIHKFQEKVKLYITENPGVLLDIDYKEDLNQINHLITR